MTVLYETRTQLHPRLPSPLESPVGQAIVFRGLSFLPMIRLAVIGAGQFGQNHIRVVTESPDAELTAIVDPDPTRAKIADTRDLIGKIDAAIISAPTSVHADLGCQLLESGIDVLIEKPIAPDLASAERLIAAAAANNRILQVGHLERFNPAVIALESVATLPLFFEIHRLSVFSPRSLDVDVVLDLMIHDLDIVLALARSPLEEVRAAGVSILSERVDIANVRLQFRDGCVANLTASRVSTERVRKLRLFQPHQYISLDYARQDVAVFTVGEERKISFRQVPVEKEEPLRLQFAAFVHSVSTRTPPKLDGTVARRTLELALMIVDKIKEHAEVVSRALSSECKP
ncbi:MAG: oxidoreductase domain protein [Bryobacterales bacterium]|nr:oxidoreductase domain protein [Bryobacterales bacterium]